MRGALRGTALLPRTPCRQPVVALCGVRAAAAAASSSTMQQQPDDNYHQQQQQQQQQGPDVSRLLTDAHCHPQLDPANMASVPQLRCTALAAMSVSHDVDWGLVQQLAALSGPKVIPGYGIHPWWAHLHASSCGASYQQLLEAPSEEQLQAAVDILSRGDPVTTSGAYATNRPESSPAAAAAAASDGDQQQQQQLGLGLRVVPLQEWHGRLRQLLLDNPAAIVGEIGLDRAATIPGSRAKTSLAHQLELLRLQVSLAAELQRPVSVHCVRGYGHLLQLFSDLNSKPQQQQQQPAWPPAIMLHSYGGSVEEVARFCALPRGLGRAFFFSFSAAINGRTAPDKLRQRIAAVPDDRLLIESDQVTPGVIDASLAAICGLVADVKGWSLQEAAERLGSNFRLFYAHAQQQQQDL